ncbi:MAG: indole-3-glycerol phosphate synthase TrpC [Sediminibacterium sp.]
MNILETIVEKKKLEVGSRESEVPVGALEKQPFFPRNTLSLKQFLTAADRTGIIAEFKRKSPSKGIINDTADVVKVTTAYAKAASGISVLTDTEFFGGCRADLEAARVNEVPVLRKDFMISEYQVIEAKAMGADVVLLIAACLTPVEVHALAASAKKLGLEVLLEINREAELEHICEEVDMVGVNNRNLKTFAVDVETSLRLLEKIPAEKPAIAESGINDVDTVVTLQQAGFKGFLMGEYFMKQTDPSIAFADFVNQLKAKQHAR